jgi:hypothetical protein
VTDFNLPTRGDFSVPRSPLGLQHTQQALITVAVRDEGEAASRFGVLKVDVQAFIGQGVGDQIRPLNDDDATPLRIIPQANLSLHFVNCQPLQTVGVHMEQRQTPPIFPHQHKSGTDDGRGDAQAFRQPLHESCLARPQLAHQAQNFATAEQ